MSATNNSRSKTRTVRSVARVYTDVNANRPKEYSDYERFTVDWGYAATLSFCIFSFPCGVLPGSSFALSSSPVRGYSHGFLSLALALSRTQLACQLRGASAH